MPASNSSANPLHLLYVDHHGWLKGWLRRRLGCQEQAADLAHDTYLRILNRDELPAPQSSRGLLVRIAQGLLIDRHRRQAIEAAYLESLAHLDEPTAPDPQTQYLIIETLIAVDAMMHDLPTKVRRAVLLRQLDGWSYAEIALELQVSVSSVEKYVARGLAACSLVLTDE